MDKRICFVLNYAPHYREAIFKKIDETFKCDFYFGDTIHTPLKKINYKVLKGFKKELKTIRLTKIYNWQFGVFFIILKKYDYYIITGDISYVSNWFLILYCNIFRKKIFLWCHGLKDKPVNKTQRRISKLFYGSKMNELLLYGNYSREIMLKEGFDKNKLHVLYNSLDSERQIVLRNKLSVSKMNPLKDYFKNNDPVLIYIGRLQEEKKLEMIIEAQNRLLIENFNVNSVFVGEGEMRNKLESLATKYKIQGKVWFYGACYDDEIIAPLIYNASLTISPGNVGLTAIHSLAFGTPVITHNNFAKQMPEFEAIIDGKTGSFFEENNISDLVDKIKSWLPILKENREKIRKDCYERIDTYYNTEYQITLLKSLMK